MSTINNWLVVLDDTRIFISIPIPITWKLVSVDTDTYFDTKMTAKF